MSTARESKSTPRGIRGVLATLVVMVTAAAGAMVLGATPVAARSGGDPDVTICHRTDAGTNPYVEQTHKAKDVWGGHYDVSPDNTVGVFGVDAQWGDIIPEFTYNGQTYGPLNMTAAGLAIYNNGCHIPDTPVTPLVPTVTGGTCETPIMTVTIPTMEGVIYHPTGVVTLEPGDHVHVTAEAADGYTLVGDHEWRFENKYDADDCIVVVSPVAPSVTQATCDHSTGLISGFQITPATTEGIDYSVNGLVVTATVQSGYKFDSPLPDGWSKVSKKVATYTVTRTDPESCLIDATPVAPQVVQSVCTGPGTASTPSVTPAADSAGIDYTLSADLSTVTATLNGGYQFALPLPAGWVMSGDNAVFATNLVSPGDCIVGVAPVSPEVTQATCDHSTGVISGFSITPATTTGITYTVNDLVVTATADPGYKLGTLPAGWVSVSETVATFTVTRTDPQSCLIDATPVAPQIVQSVCIGAGEASAPIVTPVVTTGISYIVSSDLSTVTAVLNAGYQFALPLPDGWVMNGNDAVFATNLVSPGDCLVEVVAEAPSAPPATCEAQTMTVTLPTTVGVVYTPSGSLTLAPGESVTITASAAEGYVLTGDVMQWTFTNELDLTTCGGVLAQVVAVAPTASTPSCQTPNVTVTMATIPDGVSYAASGPLTLAPGESVTVTATAAQGFELVGQSSWTIENTFDATSCAGVLPTTVVRTPSTQPLASTGTAGIRDDLAIAFVAILVGTMLATCTRRRHAH